MNQRDLIAITVPTVRKTISQSAHKMHAQTAYFSLVQRRLSIRLRDTCGIKRWPLITDHGLQSMRREKLHFDRNSSPLAPIGMKSDIGQQLVKHQAQLRRQTQRHVRYMRPFIQPLKKRRQFLHRAMQTTPQENWIFHTQQLDQSAIENNICSTKPLVLRTFCVSIVT